MVEIAERAYLVSMTFNKGARLDTSRVRRGGGGRRGGIAVGGGLGTIVVLFLLSQFLGVDLTQFVDTGTGGSSTVEDTSLAEKCRTGQDANTDVECRMVGAANSLEAYWVEELPKYQVTYRSPSLELFTQSTTTGCGAATSAIGPFYCPPDEGVYLDVGFFEVLTRQLGADEGALSQMYVVAHEWGHHVQNIVGTMDEIDRRGTGPTSDAVRLELQADCYAGAWAGDASSTEDAGGTPFLQPFTREQLGNALSAAAAVGDDRIQAGQSGRGQVSPESWTHGSAEQRQRWFVAGMQGGPGACDTFNIPGDKL